METIMCCVPGCCGKENLLAFPNPATKPDNFKAWLNFVGVDVSEYSNDHMKIYRKYKEKRICSFHFTPTIYKDGKGKNRVKYTVPNLYGPEFWSENKKRLLVTSNTTNNFIVAQKKETSNKKERKQQYILASLSSCKSTESPTVPHKSTASPRARILRKRHPLSPTNTVLRVSNPKTYLPKSTINQGSKPVQCCFQSNPTSSSMEVDKPTQISTNEKQSTELDEAGTEEDYKVEYLDSDLEKSDLEEDVPPDIEYLDINQFEDTIPKTVLNPKPNIDIFGTTKAEIEHSSDNNKSVCCEPSDYNVFPNEKQSTELDETDTEEDYEVEYLDSDLEKSDLEEDVPPDIEYLDINQFDEYKKVKKPKSVQNSKPNIDIFGTTKAEIKRSSGNNMSVWRSLERKNSKNGPALNSKILYLISTKQTQTASKNVTATRNIDVNKTGRENGRGKGHVSIKLQNEGISATENINDNKLDDLSMDNNNKLSELPYENHNLYQNIPQPPIVKQPDPIVKQLDPIVKQPEPDLIVKQPAPIVKQPDPIVKQPAPIVKPPAPMVKQPAPTDVPFQDVAVEIAKPIDLKRLETNSLLEFMSKNNLKPIDPKTPLHKELSATMTQLQKKHDLKSPIEIKSANLQEQLAACISQYSKEGSHKKKPNVYVLDSKGSILTKDQLAAASPAVQKLVESGKLITPLINLSNGSPLAPIELTQPSPAHEESVKKSSKSARLAASRVSDLRRKLKLAKNQIKRLNIRQTKLKSRLALSRKLGTNPTFLKITDKMPRIARMITTIQFRETLKPISGRRFTEDEKKLLRSLLEQCPSAYKYMLQIGFVLPQPKTLRRGDIHADIDSAISRNEAISKLQAKVNKMPTENRLCTLLFDEKQISPSNRNKQVVTAFGAEGEEANVTFEADYCLIFMIRGILQNYQEPVSYTYSFGPTNGEDLALQIKCVISDLQAIGYKVLATICDHAESNRLAIEFLTEEATCDSAHIENSVHKVFKVNDEEIIPLYDPPHLLKGIRNNLMSNNLMFEMEGQIRTAQWQHLKMMLKENPEYNGERLIAKLTKGHVFPKKQGLTNTKYASQVFSQTIAMHMTYLSEKNILPPESRDTAALLLFFDQLFDSLNALHSHKNISSRSKPLLSAVKLNSAHAQIWLKSIQVLKTMIFVNNNGAVERVSDVDCWIWSLEGYRLLLRKLFKEHKAQAVRMSHLNQDVLERLFRTEVNPSAVTREAKQKEAGQSLKSEVVTQKVLEGIHWLNKEPR